MPYYYPVAATRAPAPLSVPVPVMPVAGDAHVRHVPDSVVVGTPLPVSMAPLPAPVSPSVPSAVPAPALSPPVAVPVSSEPEPTLQRPVDAASHPKRGASGAVSLLLSVGRALEAGNGVRGSPVSSEDQTVPSHTTSVPVSSLLSEGVPSPPSLLAARKATARNRAWRVADADAALVPVL